MNAWIHGCRVYYNELLEPLGIPIVGECTVSGRLEGRGEHIIRDAWKMIGHMLDVEGEPRYRGSEIIGKRFRVNSYAITINGEVEGEMRVVDREGSILNISLVLSRSSALHWISRGWKAEEGYNIGVTMLKPREGLDWPSGQKAIPRFVVYAVEGVKNVDVSSWRLRVKGRMGSITLTYEDLIQASTNLGIETFHCVTGWSVKGVEWGGVMLGDILSRVDTMDDGWVVFKSIGGYTTVIPLEYAVNGVIVSRVNGQPLEPRHGFPARFFNPRLYGWKSAKWLTEVLVRDNYIDGVWEALAYHERGLVAAEERFKIRNPEVLDTLH